MPIVQACSYNATVKTPLPPENYSAILATFAQNGKNVVNKSKEDMPVQDGLLHVRLTQGETKLFMAGVPVLLQIRCYRNQYDAPGSAIWPINVLPAQNQEVLP